MMQKIKHGFTRADGFRFWGYAKGNEYWVSAAHYARLSKKALAAKKQRYWKNPEKFRAERRAYSKKQSAESRIKTQENDRLRRMTPERQQWTKAWRVKRMRESPSFAISVRLRVRVANALARARASKVCSTAKLLGCSWEFFLAHIEKQFLPGMNWDNRNLWHLDHIKPCAAFDLTREEDQRQCFHYSNLRPLWAEDNLTKNKTH